LYTNFSLNSVVGTEFKQQEAVRELVLNDGTSYLSLSVVTLSTKSLDDIDHLIDGLRTLRESVAQDLEGRAKKDPMLARELAKSGAKHAEPPAGKRGRRAPG
jgi:hypothetical protein